MGLCSPILLHAQHVLPLRYASLDSEINPYWSLEDKYKELSEKAKDFSYRKAVMSSRKKIEINCTGEMEDLFRKMFAVNIDKRITFAEIRQHPVFRDCFPNPSAESKILYNNKFTSGRQKKGLRGVENKLGQKLNEIQHGLLSSVVDEEAVAELPRERELLKLEVEEIGFLWNMVEELQIVEKQIGSNKSLIFAFNLVKYYIILLKQHLRGLTTANYSKKHKALKLDWHAMFATPEFLIHKKNTAQKINKA